MGPLTGAVCGLDACSRSISNSEFPGSNRFIKINNEMK